jgi:hypothetical protein
LDLFKLHRYRKLKFLVVLGFLVGQAWAKEVVLDWDSIPGAISYEFRIRKSISKESEVVHSETTSKTRWFGTLDPGFYVWQIRSLDRLRRGGAWSEDAPLAILPKSPTIGEGAISRVSGADGLKGVLQLQWDEEVGATSYRALISKDGKVILDKRQRGRTLSQPLSEYGVYSVSVWSVVEGRTTSDSPIHFYESEVPSSRVVEFTESQESKRDHELEFLILGAPYSYFTQSQAGDLSSNADATGLAGQIQYRSLNLHGSGPLLLARSLGITLSGHSLHQNEVQALYHWQKRGRKSVFSPLIGLHVRSYFQVLSPRYDWGNRNDLLLFGPIGGFEYFYSLTPRLRLQMSMKFGVPLEVLKSTQGSEVLGAPLLSNVEWSLGTSWTFRPRWDLRLSLGQVNGNARLWNASQVDRVEFHAWLLGLGLGWRF